MATYNGLLGKAKPSFNLCAFLVTGGDASAALTCTGIKTTSTILAVFHLSTAADLASIAQVDLDAVSISADDAVKYTTATNNDQLLVFWCDVTA